MAVRRSWHDPGIYLPNDDTDLAVVDPGARETQADARSHLHRGTGLPGFGAAYRSSGIIGRHPGNPHIAPRFALPILAAVGNARPPLYKARHESETRRMSDDNRTPNGGRDKEPSPNNWMKSLLIWAGILLALVLVVQMVGGSSSTPGTSIPYSEFLNKVEDGSVKGVVIGKETITGRLADNSSFRTVAPPSDPQLIQRLRDRGVAFSAQPEATTSLWMLLLYPSLPF